MRIVGINGIRCNNCPVLPRMRHSFQREFTPTEFIVEEDTGCALWQISRMREFAQELREKYDDGADLLLVGYSMGGIQACKIATELRHSRCIGIVTIFSPHTMFGGIFPRIIGASRNTQVPIISFHGAYDPFVRWGTRHPNAAAHIILSTDHYRDLLNNPECGDIVARESKRVFFPEAQG